MSTHVLNPYGDGDKALCSVRISQRPGRKAAITPKECDCEVCTIKLIRTWQRDCNMTLDAILDEGLLESMFPWEHPKYIKYEPMPILTDLNGNDLPE